MFPFNPERVTEDLSHKWERENELTIDRWDHYEPGLEQEMVDDVDSSKAKSDHDPIDKLDDMEDEGLLEETIEREGNEDTGSIHLSNFTHL